ncbi:hypothetical protein HNP84_005997 [Thermocatellispora tengchongensis]|uniref:Uncharacterized protein n=1 Tax=Thermocatellispora tengchongensis TaxID=1073253 RepID=A0A840PE86_9ACTN|nr:hypothetical protein [Thermocatellispora tengchongensis]MBB5136253.1 hypothetical protein [Thermocatellispora tengchongensis]
MTRRRPGGGSGAEELQRLLGVDYSTVPRTRAVSGLAPRTG